MSGSTTTYPFDTVVRITDVIGGVSYEASGVLIAPDEVLTATHVVYSTGIGTAINIDVSAGYEDGSTPYGIVAGVSFHYNTLDDTGDEISNEASQSDFAVIHLADPITSVGTMEVDPGFGGGQVTITGYPASANGAQVSSVQRLVVDPHYTLFDGRTIGAGSSGGPVWITGSNGQAEVVGTVSSGSGRDGYFVQFTAADEIEIEGWVAADDGTTATVAGTQTVVGTQTVSGGSSVVGTETGTVVTVSGVGGATVSLVFPISTAPLAAVLFAQLANEIAAGGVVAEAAVAGVQVPTVAAGLEGELVVSSAQAVTVPSSYGAVVDNAAGASTITLTSGANVSVVASGGVLTLGVGGASGTLVGGSDGTVFSQLSGGGKWEVALGGGANTIAALTGSDTIAAGLGQNLIFLGAGVSSILSTGSDTIVAGTGATTISASANEVLAFGNQSALTFIAGSSTSTVLGGSQGSTVSGGSSALLFFGSGATSYRGGGAADTVIGGTGRLAAQAGGGAALMFGGLAGGNILSTGGGAATLVGGGTGDLLTATGSGQDVLAAAGGAATLDGSAATGADVFFAGTGNDVIAGGSGNDAIVAGAGNDMLSGGGGVNAFIFNDGSGGGSDVITDFDASRDFLVLGGFGQGAASAAEAGRVTTAAGTVITLGDGTRVTLQGVFTLNASSLI